MDNIYIICSLIVLSAIGSPIAHAAKGDQTLSVGYAQMNSDPTKVAYSANKAEFAARLKATDKVFFKHADSDKRPQGMFIRYRYELDDTWGDGVDTLCHR